MYNSNITLNSLCTTFSKPALTEQPSSIAPSGCILMMLSGIFYTFTE